MSRARTDTRTRVMQRRERPHHLIELGGLVLKAGRVVPFTRSAVRRSQSRAILSHASSHKRDVERGGSRRTC